jgi:type II secretory pathway component PulM
MAGLGRRERTLIGGGVLIVLLVAGYLFFVEPLVDRAREAGSRATAREGVLEHRRLTIARGPRIAEELQVMKGRLESESIRLLRGPTAPLAASELQKLVKDAAAGSNMDVRSERVLPASEREGLQEVPIEIVIAGSIRDTVATLYRIQHSDRLLTVKDLKIRVMAIGQPRELLTTLTVAGYVLPVKSN